MKRLEGAIVHTNWDAPSSPQRPSTLETERHREVLVSVLRGHGLRSDGVPDAHL